MVYDAAPEVSVKAYTIGRLARMAGVSVRTLHHYDHTGLLKPSARTEAGYRLYGEPELLRLQQILFFRNWTCHWMQCARFWTIPPLTR